MQNFKLNNGVEIPSVGFGVFQINADETEQVVLNAIEAGYRHIDTAAAYENEEAVGKAIKASHIAREDFFITTKLWIQDCGYESTLKAFERSLKRLGLDYLDLYLIHQPYNDVYGSWRAMEELYRQGKIRAIGVSNFMPDRLQDLIEFNEVKPVINQIETHPFRQQIEFQAMMAKNNVQIESWGPFAEGKYNIFHNDILTTIAKKHQKSVAQVILRWLNQRGVVVIPKTVNKQRMAENLAIFDFTLDNGDLDAIKILDASEPNIVDHRDPERIRWMKERIFNT